MMKFLWSVLALAVLYCITTAVAYAGDELVQADDTDANTLLEGETADKRGFQNFMDPLGAGFASKRFNNFLDPLGAGFRPHKRRFNPFMDPLMSGFNPSKRRFNEFMDPLHSGFNNYPMKRFSQFMDPLQSGFHVKRDED